MGSIRVLRERNVKVLKLNAQTLELDFTMMDLKTGQFALRLGLSPI
jgi:hypothetical protein